MMCQAELEAAFQQAKNQGGVIDVTGELTARMEQALRAHAATWQFATQLLLSRFGVGRVFDVSKLLCRAKIT